jgi:hypothetical protein
MKEEKKKDLKFLIGFCSSIAVGVIVAELGIYLSPNYDLVWRLLGVGLFFISLLISYKRWWVLPPVMFNRESPKDKKYREKNKWYQSP